MDEQSGKVDTVLRMFSNMANKGISFGITLQVNGLVLTGTAISVKEYLNALGATFTDGLTGF
jgi:hypothetical protein